MMSMTADVCDLDEYNNGMPRKEGTFGAIYWWMVKLGHGLALVLGGLVLKLVGFDQNAAILYPALILLYFILYTPFATNLYAKMNAAAAYSSKSKTVFLKSKTISHASSGLF